MSHFPKPFFRKDRGLWYVQLDKQINLGADRDGAFRRYGELISKPRPKIGHDSIAVFLDLFLDWCKLHRACRTYDWYKERCQSFLDAIGPLSLREFKTFHVQRWVDQKDWNEGMKRGAMIAIKRAFNWLVKQGHLERSPVLGLELPPQGHRDKVISDEQYRSILSKFEDDPFGDLLELAWETGARAQELLNLESRHIDLERQCWVFPAEEAKGKKRSRVVYLNERALTITRKLVLKHPDGKLLRNEDGVAWTRHAVSCRFGRLKKKIGEKLCLTNFRHSFATHMIEGGQDAMLVAALLGHKDLSMLGRVYAHPSPQSLSSLVRKGA